MRMHLLYSRAVHRRAFLLLAAVSASAAAIAKPDSWQVSLAPFHIPGMTERGGTATFAPIDSIDGTTIRLRGEDGGIATFRLSAKTIYCNADQAAPDWTHLKAMVALGGVATVMTNIGVDYALVVWDQERRLIKGPSVFPRITFPTLCK